MSTESRFWCWIKRKLTSVACIVAFVALALAAANRLALAVYVGLLASVVLIASAVVHAFSQLPETAKNRIISRRNIQRIAIFALISAVVISCTFWFGGWKLKESVKRSEEHTSELQS